MKRQAYPNQTIELLYERASCRSWTDEQVPPKVLHTILEAGTHAATAGNLQPYAIITIEAQATKQILAEACGQPFIAKAPVILMFCIDWRRSERWARLEAAPFKAPSIAVHFWLAFHDTVICTQTVATAADAMGLGSVYLAVPPLAYAQLQEQCHLPQKVMPLSMLCLGYPKARPKPRRKLPVEVVVHAEQYHEMDDEALVDSFHEKYGSEGHHRITEERLQRIGEVCRAIHGEEFASRCLDRIKTQGYVNQAQYLFGDCYRAHIHLAKNPEHLDAMESCGFDWFKT